MILTTHALVGAAIGKNVGSPWLIIPVSLVIHYFLDSFRHGEYFDDRTANIKNTYKKVLIDLAVAFSIVLFIFYLNDFDFLICRNILIGSFFSLLPDGLTLIYYWNPKIKIFAQIKKFHSWSHRYGKFPKYSPERQWNFRNSINDIFLSSLAVIFLLI